MISPCLPTAHSMNRPAPPPSRGVEAAVRIRFVLLQPRQRVMRDPAALHRRRTNLDRADPPRLGEPGLDDGLAPLVERLRRHRVRRRLDDEVGRPAEQLGEVPHVVVWQTSSAAACPSGSPFGAPASTQRTMVSISSSAQRAIVLELLNADGLVDVPRRHLPRRHPRLDRPAPTAASLRRSRATSARCSPGGGRPDTSPGGLARRLW